MIPPSRYTSPLRDRQKQATQDQIMHAVARKLESNEISPQQFAMERDDIEAQLQARLR